MTYILGLDLAPVTAETALAIVQTIRAPMREIQPDPFSPRIEQVPSGPDTLQVRYLERFPIGTRYPAMVTAVDRYMHSLPEDWTSTDPAQLVVDATAVGAPVVDLFHDAGLKPVAITIVAGTAPTLDGAGWHLPKRDLVSVLQVLLQSRRLQFADDLPEADLLRAELPCFTAKITTKAYDLDVTWREGTNDCLVLAVAIATWYLEQGYVAPWTKESLMLLARGAAV